MDSIKSEQSKRIGERIAKARKDKNLSQVELGRLCGMADSAIGRIELGKTNPTTRTLQRIAGALGCDVSLFYGSEEEQWNYVSRILISSFPSLVIELPYLLPLLDKCGIKVALEDCFVFEYKRTKIRFLDNSAFREIDKGIRELVTNYFEELVNSESSSEEIADDGQSCE